MNLITNIITWTENTFRPLGSLGLFILAFMESSFFPIPPDLLLIVLCLAEPDKALLFAAVCTAGSVLGGMFGYLIGYIGEETILKRFFPKKKIAKVHRLFNKYEAWAVGIAAFTPLPYKIFTISAGVFYVNFKKFVIASLVGRGARFFILATAVMFYGESVKIYIEEYFNWFTILAVVFVFLVYVFYVKVIKKRSRIFSFF